MRARRVGRGYVRKYRGRSVWWIEYWHGQKRKRESSGVTAADNAKRAPAAVQEFLLKRQAEIASDQFIGPEADRFAFEDVAAMVVRHYQLMKCKSVPPLARLREFFGRVRAADITVDAVVRYILHRREQGASDGTIKNEVAVLGQGLRMAEAEDRITRPPKMPRIRVDNARRGFFTDAEVHAVLEHLPEYLRPFVETAYITGWRRGELRSFKWAQVDWQSGMLHLLRGTTKSGEPRSFPFAADPRLAALLEEQRTRTTALERENGQVIPWVFHREGREMRAWYYDAWRTACRKAGVPGRLVHDLRRSAVRNLIRAGVTEHVAMKLSGHKTRSVFDRYDIVSGADLVDGVKKLAASRADLAPAARKVVAMEDAVAEPDSWHVRGTVAARKRIIPAKIRENLASPTGFEPVSPP